MTNNSWLAHTYEAVDLLLITFADHLDSAQENDSQFSLTLLIEKVERLQEYTEPLIPFIDIIDFRVKFRIQDGAGTLVLNEEGWLETDEPWTEDSDLSPPDIDQSTLSEVSQLRQHLSKSGESIQVDIFVATLRQLIENHSFVELTLRIFIDKEVVLGKVGWADNIHGILYLSTQKLWNRIVNVTDYNSLCHFFVPKHEERVVILLGDGEGIGIGPNSFLVGRNYWTLRNDVTTQPEELARIRVHDALEFLHDECSIEFAYGGLTPHHFDIKINGFGSSPLTDLFLQLRDTLSVMFLANRVRKSDDIVQAEFMGYKRVRVNLPAFDGTVNPCGDMYKLFNWAYENKSSDKIGILRQIVSLLLGEDSETNYQLILDKSNEILVAAKSNFQIYLRRSVELYFDKRLRVSEYLQKFSEEIGASVSALTSELVGNLYKTVGVILGFVIASLLEPERTSLFAFWAAFLYLVYILFILFYLLPSIFLRFINKRGEYKWNVEQLMDVLSKAEILKLQGDSYNHNVSLFIFFFIITFMLYGAIGFVAFLIVSVTSVKVF